MLQSLSCRVRIFQTLTRQFLIEISTVQSAGRDFGPIDETDYAVLIQTKLRARELMIRWLFEAIDEENTEPPPVSPLTDDL